MVGCLCAAVLPLNRGECRRHWLLGDREADLAAVQRLRSAAGTGQGVYVKAHKSGQARTNRASDTRFDAFRSWLWGNGAGRLISG